VRKSQLEDHLRRQAAILRNARVRMLVAAPEVRPLARLLTPLVPDLGEVTTPAELLAGGLRGRLPTVAGGDVAFLQYTSGSTGEPKGVVLSHDNLLANLRSVGRVLHLRGDDVVVSWLPLYHDMGLIGAWMGSLYFGVPLVLMSPLTFLARPLTWLRAIAAHRGTISAAPNFAYALCVKKVPEEELAALDLSSWRIALNGAEPVSADVVESFAARFARCGFRRETMMPVYGLAESSLALAFTPPGRGPRIDAVARQPLQRDDRAVPAAADEPQPLRLVSSGYPIPDHEVRIVDERGRELPERRQGRLQFRGPSATSGYFRNPEATAALFQGGPAERWLESGDLAYVADGEVFITGRSKDLVIRAGRNLHPQELEEAVGSLPGVRKGCVAVFAATASGEGTERLVVLAETRPLEPATAADLRQRVAELAIDLVGTAPDEVVLVPPGTVPKTSSGKIRRATARELYEGGRLARSGGTLGWQVLRLAAAGALPRLRRLLERAAHLAWAVWAWSLFALLTPPTWLAVVLLPGLARRRGAARHGARLLAAGTASPLRIQGLEGLPVGPCVVACNHQSYLDAFLLTALLPPRFAFVAKGELGRRPFTRLPLLRLGAVLVDRFDAEKGTEDARRAAAAVAAGDSLAVFPEGTFFRAPGLLPFRLGAFVVAARSGVPVVPMVLRGSRSVLRAGQWLPRRGVIAATVGGPIAPAGSSWSDVLALRDATRTWMLAHAAEPDLAE
jgi:1-acyl-sn-glycerol-3-phosphate acyltransferase